MSDGLAEWQVVEIDQAELAAVLRDAMNEVVNALKVAVYQPDGTLQELTVPYVPDQPGWYFSVYRQSDGGIYKHWSRETPPRTLDGRDHLLTMYTVHEADL